MIDNPIPIESPKKEFQDHLEIENNDRIFFSGPFGIGKTYFLREFFKKKEDEYACIQLYPVNYSVAQNEDIFELIKYDILYELLKNPELFDQLGIDKSIKAAEYVKGKLPSFLGSFVEHLSDLQKEDDMMASILMKAVHLLGNQTKSFEKFSEEIDKDLNELKVIEEFSEEIESKLGSIYENNLISQLIHGVIKKLKDSGKKTVLIIDDLDRIDPEHIFRILNVFSAHFDFKEETESEDTNKFGFDKVIVVAHYENIQSIFQHKYGIDADFNGYVDKFYSVEKFNFDNRSTVLSWFEEYFISPRSSIQLNWRVKQAMFPVISFLVHENLLSLRSLLKLNKKELDRINYKVNKSDKNRFLLGFIYSALLSLYSSHVRIIEVLDKVIDITEKSGSDYPFQTDFLTSTIEITLPVLAQNKFNEFSYESGTVNMSQYEGVGDVELKLDHYNLIADPININHSRVKIWQLVKESFVRIHDLKLLER